MMTREQVEMELTQYLNDGSTHRIGILLAHDAALRTELAAVREERDLMERLRDTANDRWKERGLVIDSVKQQLADLQGKLNSS